MKILLSANLSRVRPNTIQRKGPADGAALARNDIKSCNGDLMHTHIPSPPF